MRSGYRVHILLLLILVKYRHLLQHETLLKSEFYLKQVFPIEYSKAFPEKYPLILVQSQFFPTFLIGF